MDVGCARGDFRSVGNELWQGWRREGIKSASDRVSRSSYTFTIKANEWVYSLKALLEQSRCICSLQPLLSFSVLSFLSFLFPSLASSHMWIPHNSASKSNKYCSRGQTTITKQQGAGQREKKDEGKAHHTASLGGRRVCVCRPSLVVRMSGMWWQFMDKRSHPFPLFRHKRTYQAFAWPESPPPTKGQLLVSD